MERNDTTPPFPAALLERVRLKHLALVEALATHRSITLVAKHLGASQPNVTRSLLEIEEIFRDRLFIRSRRGLELTAAGRTVLAYAKSTIAGNQALAHELDMVRGGRRGRLRVGLIPYVSGAALTALWQHLLALDPRMTVSTVEGTTAELVTLLREGGLDCALCRFSHDELGGHVVQDLLYQQQAHLVFSAASAGTIGRRPALDMASLSEMDWIFPPSDTPTRRIIDAIFASAGRRTPSPILEANSIRLISTAMEWMPRGVTVLPRDIAQVVASSGSCTMLEEPLPWRMPPVGLAWMAGSEKSPAVASLAAAIRKAVGTA